VKLQHVKELIERPIEFTIFASRWLQAPLYVGLILAQCAYTYKFILELVHLIASSGTSTELQLLLGILSLVDVTMVCNLVAVVIIGGYATFVSKLNLDGHEDKPSWLDHIDPGSIKVKLSSSLIGISSIHLLRAFVDMKDADMEKIKWQIIIHFSFIASTIFLALSEFLMTKKQTHSTHRSSH
jgi:uncharacterized protein (TIGR00645 family)